MKVSKTCPRCGAKNNFFLGSEFLECMTCEQKIATANGVEILEERTVGVPGFLDFIFGQQTKTEYKLGKKKFAGLQD